MEEISFELINELFLLYAFPQIGFFCFCLNNWFFLLIFSLVKMLEDLEEDTHLCIKCSRTIVGLENYVRHRKNHCTKSVSSSPSLNRGIIGTAHSYQSFELAEPSSKHDDFNYEIESVPDHEDSHSDVIPSASISPMHQSGKTIEYKTDTSKSLSESYDGGADFFFSLLNLQSSKLKTQSISTSASTSLIKTTDKISHVKASNSSSLGQTEHMDDWINSASPSGTDKLIKAVNAISGTKKPTYDLSSYDYDYAHVSPSYDVDDEEPDEIVEDLVEDDIPPHTHTGKTLTIPVIVCMRLY